MTLLGDRANSYHCRLREPCPIGARNIQGICMSTLTCPQKYKQDLRLRAAKEPHT